MSFLSRVRLARDRSVTVANLVDELLRRNGDREISVDDAGTNYLSGMHAEITSTDAFLRQEVGLQPGQPVAIYRTNDPRCFRWFLAVIRAGGIAVPLNPMLTLAEVRRILATSGTEILVTDKAVFESRIQGREALNVRTWIQVDDEPDTLAGFLRPPEIDKSIAITPDFPPAVIDPAATIAVFHTSGTSGFPKGASLSSRALLGPRGFSAIAGLFLGANDLGLVALPWSHIMSVSIALYGLMAGTRGCFLDRFEVEKALEVVERRRITAFIGVPAMFHRLVEANPDPARLASVRVWVSASDHLPSEVRERLRKFGAFLRLPAGRRVPPVLVNGYGMVELGGMAMMGIDLSFAPGSGDLCFPVPPFKIRVADETGRPVKTGATGECQIRRRGVTPHYWTGSEKTRPDPTQPHQPQFENALGSATLQSAQPNAARPDPAQFEAPGLALEQRSPTHNDLAPPVQNLNDDLLTPDGWLRTGDLAVRNRLGLIRLVGRIKDVIKSGGYSVYARELEEAIAAHPAVSRAAAFGLPHKDKGEYPAAAVELHSDAAATEADLLTWCRDQLAPYKAPRRIWILPPGDLPQNHTGKVLRRELRDRFSAEAD